MRGIVVCDNPLFHVAYSHQRASIGNRGMSPPYLDGIFVMRILRFVYQHIGTATKLNQSAIGFGIIAVH